MILYFLTDAGKYRMKLLCTHDSTIAARSIRIDSLNLIRDIRERSYRNAFVFLFCLVKYNTMRNIKTLLLLFLSQMAFLVCFRLILLFKYFYFVFYYCHFLTLVYATQPRFYCDLLWKEQTLSVAGSVHKLNWIECHIFSYLSDWNMVHRSHCSLLFLW